MLEHQVSRIRCQDGCCAVRSSSVLDRSAAAGVAIPVRFRSRVDHGCPLYGPMGRFVRVCASKQLLPVSAVDVSECNVLRRVGLCRGVEGTVARSLGASNFGVSHWV